MRLNLQALSRLIDPPNNYILLDLIHYSILENATRLLLLQSIPVGKQQFDLIQQNKIRKKDKMYVLILLSNNFLLLDLNHDSLLGNATPLSLQSIPVGKQKFDLIQQNKIIKKKDKMHVLILLSCING